MFEKLKKWQKLAGIYILVSILLSFLNIGTNVATPLVYIISGIILFYYFKIDGKTEAKFLGLGIVLRFIMTIVFLPWLTLQYTTCINNVCTLNIPENMLWAWSIMPDLIIPIIAMIISAYVVVEVWR